MPEKPFLSVHDAVQAEDARVIDQGLDDSNAAAAPIHDVRALACFARLEAGTVVGGAIGRTWGECCELQRLWVHPTHRRAGLGTRVMGRIYGELLCISPPPLLATMKIFAA